MVDKSIVRKLAAVERQLLPQKAKIQEIFVSGGLVKGIGRQARIVGGETIQAERDETLEDFRRRMLEIAEREGSNTITYGGLPDAPVDWAIPPGQDEALALARDQSSDEIDL
jgi:hypothetical protein